MIRSPLRCLALVGLGLAGLLAAVLAVLMAPLIIPYPSAVAGTRRLANLGRRLAERWGGVAVEVPYRPGPPQPPRREDGWYVHERQLYRSRHIPTFFLRLKWITEDPATGRDLLWYMVTPFTVGILVLLSPALIIGGLAGPWLLPIGLGLPAALVAVPLGFVIGPAALRLYALWTRTLLQPRERSWWHRSALGRWTRRQLLATWRGAGLAGLALATLGGLVLNVLTLVVAWGLLLPQATGVSRLLLDIYRRRLRIWANVDIPDPYRPAPEPPVPGPDGLYRIGRTLYARPASAVWAQRHSWVLRDPATWRDLLWMVTSPPLTLIGLIPALLVGFGLFGLVSQFIWWGAWAVPLGLISGVWVTPWYVWYAASYGWTDLAAVSGAFSIPIGLFIAGIGLILNAPLLKLRLAWDRQLLGPTKETVLAQRVRRLTETRADAIDAQAAELRRIERDLHDGAQARLVAVGLSLATVERLMDTDPDTARALLAQARDTSATALTELRDLVRGIHPPVLAERGLGDAIRAVALDCPLRVDVTVDLPGRLDPPVESAAYFAVCEALANAVRHGRSNRIDVSASFAAGLLRITVTDDGRGGAQESPAGGLRGIRRRLGTFDGVLTLHSPPGGPTVVTMEVPCALSSPRTSTS